MTLDKTRKQIRRDFCFHNMATEYFRNVKNRKTNFA